MSSSPALERITEVLDVLPVAVAVLRRRDGTIAYANARLGALLEVPVDDVVGRPLDEFVTPARRLAVSRSPAVDVEPDLRLVVVQDATAVEPAQDRDAAHASVLAQLAELPEKNPGPVCRLTRDGTILMANAAARRFLGASDVRGRSWLDLCPGMSRELWNRVLDSDTLTPHEAERNGVWILFSHVRSDAGDLVFAYGADITARRRDEQKLAEQAARLAEVARFPEMNPGPVLRLDDTTAEVLMANAAARGVFGAELVGRSWYELCPGVAGAFWRRALAAAGPVPHEARIGGRDYVFAHRHDPTTRLVFVFGADITAQKRAERALRQSEKMATLGTLAAGVAHELNNPAAATRRAADHLREAFAQLEDAHFRIDALSVPREGWDLLRSVEDRAREHAVRPVDLRPLERSDREAAVEDWLDDHGVADPWDLAPALVAQGLDPEGLSRLSYVLDAEQLSAALEWAAAAFRVYTLSHEIGQGSARISEIVGALKSYSYLGKAPVQAVDLHEGLDSTLVIMRNKLKVGVEVRRDYAADLPRIAAYGSELNQVWTNLIDNAVDAMDGHGEITIRTRRDGGWAVVEISDDGPGIPEALQSKVFDPFFTTKAPGKGTGLGLSTSYSIVVEKHGGMISVESRPGFTRFTVRLPFEQPSEGDQKVGRHAD